jgi:HD-GYP domain-containing protein (c-di-GMP phosphodiesterase class II)
MVAVADTWISMVEDRPYRKGRSLAKAGAEMRRVAGTQLDAAMVDALFAVEGVERPEALAEAA